MSKNRSLPSKENIKWSGELLRTKNFILLTDTDSVIRLQGLDPLDIKDITRVTAYRRALEGFDKKLHSIIKDFKEDTKDFGEAIKVRIVKGKSDE